MKSRVRTLQGGRPRVRSCPAASHAIQRRSRKRTQRKALQQLDEQNFCSGDRGGGVKRV